MALASSTDSESTSKPEKQAVLEGAACDGQKTTPRKAEGSANLKSLKYIGGDEPELEVLDQLLIPYEKVYISIRDVHTTWTVIRSMQIRGAPLIAIVTCLGLSVDLKTSSKKQLDEVEKTGNGQIVLDFILTKMDYLQTSRPTAVNLFNAMGELRQRLCSLYQSCNQSNICDVRRRLVDGVQTYAEFTYSRDEKDNKAMGAYGADELLKERFNKEFISIMTICNTGSLATATYGTALGVVRAVHERRQLRQIVALETRPYNQGSRLTAFELVEDGLPGVLICDGMAASFIKTHGIDAVVIGADRVCANGDTANKIGSYNLSLVAAAHQVPVYVVAPFTTLDITHPSGDHVVIEERPPCELIESSKGPNINVWNPSFDITPARYITAIITEKGIIRPAQDGTIDVTAFVRRHLNDDYSQSEDGSEHHDEILYEHSFAGDTKRKVPRYCKEQSGVSTLPLSLSKKAKNVMEENRSLSVVHEASERRPFS